MARSIVRLPGPQPTSSRPDPDAKKRQQVGRGVVSRPPAVRPQHRFLVSVGIGVGVGSRPHQRERTPPGMPPPGANPARPPLRTDAQPPPGRLPCTGDVLRPYPMTTIRPRFCMACGARSRRSWCMASRGGSATRAPTGCSADPRSASPWSSSRTATSSWCSAAMAPKPVCGAFPAGMWAGTSRSGRPRRERCWRKPVWSWRSERSAPPTATSGGPSARPSASGSTASGWAASFGPATMPSQPGSLRWTVAGVAFPTDVLVLEALKQPDEALPRPGP